MQLGLITAVPRLLVICSPNTAFHHVSKSSIEWCDGGRCAWPFSKGKECRQDPFVRGDFLRSFGPPIVTQWRCCVGTRISNDWYWSGVSFFLRVRMRGPVNTCKLWFLCGCLSTDSLMFSLRMQERFDMKRFETTVSSTDVLLKGAPSKAKKGETYP